MFSFLSIPSLLIACTLCTVWPIRPVGPCPLAMALEIISCCNNSWRNLGNIWQELIVPCNCIGLSRWKVPLHTKPIGDKLVCSAVTQSDGCDLINAWLMSLSSWPFSWAVQMSSQAKQKSPLRGSPCHLVFGSKPTSLFISKLCSLTVSTKRFYFNVYWGGGVRVVWF